MRARTMKGVALGVTALARCSSSGSPATADAGPAIAPFVCDPDRGAIASVAGFSRETVEARGRGPAYVDVADVNGDGTKDLVVTSLGHEAIDGSALSLAKASAAVHLRGPAPGCWSKHEIVGGDAGLYFTNEPKAADVDGDGEIDLVVAAGFFVCPFDKSVGNCGALTWLENLGGAASWRRHDLLGPGDTELFHRAVLVDFDGDGVRDLVTVGESSAGALGSFPVVADIDGDGRLDVAAAEYFVPGESFAWMLRTASGFDHFVLDDTSGRGLMMAIVPNLSGDGVTRAIGTNHVNASDDPAQASGVFVLSAGTEATAKWSKTTISEGIVSRPSEGQRVQGAPGVFEIGDIDGDARTFWLEQTAPGSFTTHVLEPKLGQAGGARVVDLDGDGANDLVFTGYEDDTVYVYRRARR